MSKFALVNVNLVALFNKKKPVDSINEENKESDVNKCSNCGTELKYGEKFCPNCGQSTNKVDDNYPKNFCPDCGEKLSENAKFCPNCGFDLSNVSKNVQNKNVNNDTVTKCWNWNLNLNI